MNVLLVSQCSKRALSETRRILDQFAERRGDRTWQTPITQEGLDTLRKMLKRTARKNTAVACHWIRGRDHSELVWIVGNASRFNAQGAVPTNTTGLDVLRRKDENDWVTAEDIRLLAVVGALFHDFGKANRAFQAKLRARRPFADAYRHEWVSLRLFEAFVGDDDDPTWVHRLSECDTHSSDLCLERLVRDDQKGARSPFRPHHLPPLAQAVGWLIVTHHRLPVAPSGIPVEGLRALLAPILPDWNSARADAEEREKKDCWRFEHGLPFASADWCRRAQSCARLMLARPGFAERGNRILDDPYVMHLARLALMLADHHYSSLRSDPQERHYGDGTGELYANTIDAGTLNQRLDEHLAGVASHARRVVRALPRLERDLPRIARYKSFQRRTKDDRFRWQDKAYDVAVALRHASSQRGFFGVNMASTGCGKTLANGRILYGLADPQKGARFTVALGLRTLTLQTGTAYRKRLGLGEEDLAVLVGGAAVRHLFELNAPAESVCARRGSESAEDLLPEESGVLYEGSLIDGPFKLWLKANPRANKLLQAPVLACTIDHIVPATEGLRGGRQIAPMLRLMSSDLVLDEPDDFDLDDLPALSRLVHWAGLLGSRVLLSSATLPPSLVQGLFEAYRAGRKYFQRNRGAPGRPLAVPCAWFDEFRCQSHTVDSADHFRSAHAEFVEQRLAKLRQTTSRRTLEIVPIGSPSLDRADVCQALAEQLPEWIGRLHRDNSTTDPKSGKRASFGLVRLANIEPLIMMTERLYAGGAPSDMRFHPCVYHSRHPLLMRSSIETLLDSTLLRQSDRAVFDHPSVRARLDGFPEPDQVFIVIASPVAEVGRDHDYDWAIVEPSSMRSIIQLAGRIRRHRPGAYDTPNVFVLNRNLNALQGRRPAFIRPGFEGYSSQLKTYALEELLTPEQLTPLDAGPRIRERHPLRADCNLADLEHQRLRVLMLGTEGTTRGLTVPHWWETRAWMIGELQARQRFRKSDVPEGTYALLPDEEHDFPLRLHRFDEHWTAVGNLLREMKLDLGPRIAPWGPTDLLEEVSSLAERVDLTALECARKYGRVQLEEGRGNRVVQGWEYHPALGFRQLS